MSTYFSIYTKKKDEDLKKAGSCFELFHLCTTAARELDKTMNFIYCERTPINSHFIDKIIEVYKEEIRKNEEQIKVYEEDKRELESRIQKIQNPEIYEIVDEDISSIKSQIDFYKSKNEAYRDTINKFITVATQMDNNDDVYDYYYNFE